MIAAVQICLAYVFELLKAFLTLLTHLGKSILIYILASLRPIRPEELHFEPPVINSFHFQFKNLCVKSIWGRHAEDFGLAVSLADLFSDGASENDRLGLLSHLVEKSLVDPSVSCKYPPAMGEIEAPSVVNKTLDGSAYLG